MDNRLCRQCGKLYKNSSSLNRHIISAHSGTTYKCKLCPMEYKRTDNLANHVMRKHGGDEAQPPRNNWANFPQHKGTSTDELRYLTTVDRASSPINCTENLPTLATKVREINPEPTKKPEIEGKVLTGKVIPPYRPERRWMQQLKAENPTPTPKVDVNKIKDILAKPKVRVRVSPAQESQSLDPLGLCRLPTRPSLYNPATKKPKISLPAPAKKKPNIALILPMDANNGNPEMQPGTSTQPDTPMPVCLTQSPHTSTGTGQSKPTPKQGEATLQKAPKRPTQRTLDSFVKRLRPNNPFKPALDHVNQSIVEVDKALSKFGCLSEDLQLSSDSESDSEMEEAAAALEKAVLDMN